MPFPWQCGLRDQGSGARGRASGQAGEALCLSDEPAAILATKAVGAGSALRPAVMRSTGPLRHRRSAIIQFTGGR